MSELLSKTEKGVKRSRESWFNKITNLFTRNKIEQETWDELEELLIAADVGVATTEKLLQALKRRVREEKLEDSSEVRAAMKEEIEKLLTIDAVADKPDDSMLKVVLVVGVNGSGKTTSIAKLASYYKITGRQVVLAAADTFRAAAIDQLRQWGDRVGVYVVAHQPGADPGAVVYDAIQAARNRKAQVVIVDTAGRLHTKFNLMEELKKIKRITDKQDVRQEVLLVMDATTGQNGLLQARHFNDAVGINGIFLTKLDGTAKGGIVLAISDELKIPIVYIGTGEQLEDMVPFDARTFVDAIFVN